MKKGYVQVYTGNGKGKTTAAFGLALRAAGAGLKVFIGQFAKQKGHSEHAALERFSDLITVKQYGLGRFIRNAPTEGDALAAKTGLEEARQAMLSGKWDLIILDEANVAVSKGLFAVDDLLEFIDSRPESVELLLTGRRADEKVIQRADLVTEMKEIRHYYKKGVKARKGIEK